MEKGTVLHSMEETTEKIREQLPPEQENMTETQALALLFRMRPLVDDYARLARAACRRQVLEEILRMPRFAALGDQLERCAAGLLRFYPELEGIEPVRLYALCSALLQGGRPGDREKLTPQALADLVDADPEAQKLLDGRRRDAVRGHASLPAASASGGVLCSPGSLVRRPADLEEAREALSRLLG